MKYLVLSCIVFLTACARPEPEPIKPIVIERAPIERPAFRPPPVSPFVARDVEWIIVTPENVDDVFARFQASNQPLVVFAVTEQGYKNIAINNQSALRVIVQQQAVIDGYRKYYVRSN
jgi:hypothetical protein